MICTSCGEEIRVGDWPYCPHGVAHVAVQPDDLIGGFAQEHFSDRPEVFYSKKAMLKRADELGLRQVGDGDRYRGGYGITAKTLEDARELLSRGSSTANEMTCETATFTVREL